MEDNDMGRIRGIPDGSGPHGRGAGPGGGKRDGSGMRNGSRKRRPVVRRRAK